LRLLYEANPVGMVMEQAGGRASTGRQPVLGVKPGELHQRIGLVFGSRHEVERIERYHHEPEADRTEAPLFAARSLFRD
jgi:fructose-1,6-bisphosphatase I/sedoheptulose-1,7-bisphosphatase